MPKAVKGEISTSQKVEAFIRNAIYRGELKPRERLIEEVSERRFDVFDRSIDVHVSSLRKKLGDDAKSPRFIHTIRGIGYSLHEPEYPAPHQP